MDITYVLIYFVFTFITLKGFSSIAAEIIQVSKTPTRYQQLKIFPLPFMDLKTQQSHDFERILFFNFIAHNALVMHF